MSLRSRFSFWIILIIGMGLLVTGLFAFIVEKLLERSGFPPIGICGLLIFLIFIWVWIVFGEMRTKAIRVYIQDEEITVSNYFGLGTKKIYKLSRFDGLETSLLPSRYDTYEYLYLIDEGKKVVKLSQFYHRNYAELKSALTARVRNLGEKDFSYLQEIKEIFI